MPEIQRITNQPDSYEERVRQQPPVDSGFRAGNHEKCGTHGWKKRQPSRESTLGVCDDERCRQKRRAQPGRSFRDAFRQRRRLFATFSEEREDCTKEQFPRSCQW